VCVCVCVIECLVCVCGMWHWCEGINPPALWVDVAWWQSVVWILNSWCEKRVNTHWGEHTHTHTHTHTGQNLFLKHHLLLDSVSHCYYHRLCLNADLMFRFLSVGGLVVMNWRFSSLRTNFIHNSDDLLLLCCCVGVVFANVLN